MTELYVLTPSRGRPKNAVRLAEAFHGLTDTHLVIVVDEDDLNLNDYNASLHGNASVIVSPHGEPGIVRPLNWAAQVIIERHHPAFLGFMGDDHLPQSAGWNDAIIESLGQLKTGVAYGNDLLMGEKLPTAAFLTTDIVETLGFMAPEQLRHLYVDNYWYDLGQGLGRIKYLHDVIIEHLHPSANSAIDWDQTYEAANNPNIERDRTAYSLYVAKGLLERDIKKVQGLL